MRTPPLIEQPDKPEFEIVDESLSAHGDEPDTVEHQTALEAAE